LKNSQIEIFKISGVTNMLTILVSVLSFAAGVWAADHLKALRAEWEALRGE
jgi:hypothetical protein